jgi:imidazole glycerol phosphate synthase subunit HisF
MEAGVKMLEPNHPAVALARGLHGVSDMHDAEIIRHEVTIEEMVRVVRGIRAVGGQDLFITVAVPGGFTETQPVLLSDKDFADIARAGADGLHTHKSSLKDLAEWVAKAHHYGLVVDAYIAHPDDRHPFGVPASTPEEVAKTAQEMQDIGVDLIGLMTGMSYEGVGAGKIPSFVEERLAALIDTVAVPTVAEGGINLDNVEAFRNTGVNVLVVGTSFDDVSAKAVSEAARRFLASAREPHGLLASTGE